MKSLSRLSVLSAVAAAAMILPFQSASAEAPKREMRSAWVATVWQLDWPQTTISSTGNEVQVEAQKEQMIALLDSLANNNMNAVNFQVRSRSDAMYKSSYEPWSSDLVAERGMDPGYDPLAFVVEESHKRGMECHAWVNPYRYESVAGQWSGMAGDIRAEHPDWIMDNDGAAILNPGKQEVIDYITEVCREIVKNYDIDGILFDDYFYLGGTPYETDADLYEAYVAAGGTLEQGDWRRDNVNRMVRSIYDMIQEEKPWVRFGISPAGVACTNANVANKYGITPCPSGSDWQYDDIYSDPIAWLADRSLDYISPQIYWSIGNSSADYGKIAPWWSEVTAHFDRHFYSSHSISSIKPSSDADDYQEFVDQIEINREYTENEAPGSIFYSCKYLYRKGNTGTTESMVHYLRRFAFTRPALLPAMPWKKGENPGLVKNLVQSGYNLSWEGYDNVRYTVYAVPENVEQSQFNCQGEYLLGTSYDTNYEIPQAYATGYQYAVCVLDRMGNEYSPLFVGVSAETLPAPELIEPEEGAEVIDPFVLSWTAVDGAAYYIVEVSEHEDFSSLIASITTEETSTSSAQISGLKNAAVTYWRVRACAANHNDGVSKTGTFVPQVLSVTYPENDAKDINPALTITWNIVEDGVEAKVEVSTVSTFGEGNIAFSGTSTNGSIDIPPYTLLSGTTYYVRVSMTRMGIDMVSDVVKFTTAQMDATVPVVLNPVEGGTLYANSYIELEGQQGARSLVVEVSNSATTWGRSRFIETLTDFRTKTSVPAGEMKVNGSTMTNGETYYVRARASYVNADGVTTFTEYSEPVSFIYDSALGVNGVVAESLEAKVVGGAMPYVVISSDVPANVEVRAYSLLGVDEGELFNGETTYEEIPLDGLAKGVHLITVTANGETRTLKVVK